MTVCSMIPVASSESGQVKAADDRLLRMDIQLQEMEAKRRRLLKQRNQLSPISRLPSNVLSEIFQACTMGAPSSFTAIKLALRLCRVCAQWRAILVNDPRFWTVYSFPFVDNNPSFVGELLARSKTAPITVKIESSIWSHHSPSNIIKEGWQALYHLSHIRKLSIACGCKDARNYLFYLKTIPAPLLEEFRLRSTDGNLLRCPEDLFCFWAAPNLHRLELGHCRLLDPTNPALRSLTSLNLRFCVFQFRDLLDVLSNTPSLSKLSLANNLPPKPDMTLYLRGPVIHLPRLQDLTLDDHPILMRALMERISFPPSLVFTVRDQIDGRRTLPINSHILALATAAATTEPLQSLMVSSTNSGYGTPTSFIVSGSRTETEYSAHHLDTTRAHVYLYFWRRMRYPDFRWRALTDICLHLPLEHVQTLTISDCSPVEAWGEVLHRFSSVQTLCLQALQSMTEFLELLIPAPVDGLEAQVRSSQPTSQDLRTMPLPILSKVKLGLSRGNMDEEDVDQFLWTLERFLSARRAKGAGIAELEVAGLRLNRQDRESLASYVGTFRFDVQRPKPDQFTPYISFPW
ncbi:hypothetical protein EW146_g1986 [Bondarzewia mesenterica]|uniref:F-box/LRR-repeat protein 15/At3g58940/PEG3-like LRR domain-containing protein n=1 Tax=Bondarzewia mesenterica TaxID=1095465 RepID=A0A4S4M213_9AGAM|nr:hypothetical protein EW146_g1986 [Bondarzewia mesenterica]